MQGDSTACLGLDELAALFTESFRDYAVPVAMTPAAMAAHIAANGIDTGASRLLRIDGQPAGLALLGRRGPRGWVGGIGVVPPLRGRGFGRRLMLDLIESARQCGLRCLQLEVFETNVPAAGLYRTLGFVPRRRLVGLEGPPVEAAAPGSEASLDELPASLGDPCWQREAQSLRDMADLRAVRLRGRLAAYRAAGGQLRLLALSAADPASVRSLLGALAARHPGLPYALSNEPAGSALAGTLRALGWRETYRQEEMIMDIVPRRG